MDNWYDKLHFDPAGIIIELGIMNNWAESGGLFCAQYKYIRNPQTLQEYIFQHLQQFATKLYNFTNFNRLFSYNTPGSKFSLS